MKLVLNANEDISPRVKTRFPKRFFFFPSYDTIHRKLNKCRALISRRRGLIAAAINSVNVRRVRLVYTHGQCVSISTSDADTHRAAHTVSISPPSVAAKCPLPFQRHCVYILFVVFSPPTLPADELGISCNSHAAAAAAAFSTVRNTTVQYSSVEPRTTRILIRRKVC